MTKPTQIAQRAAHAIGNELAPDLMGANIPEAYRKRLNQTELRFAELIDAAGVGELVEALRDLMKLVEYLAANHDVHIADNPPKCEEYVKAEAALSKHAGRATETQGDKHE